MLDEDLEGARRGDREKPWVGGYILQGNVGLGHFDKVALVTRIVGPRIGERELDAACNQSKR
jgi:hypothetical protein